MHFQMFVERGAGAYPGNFAFDKQGRFAVYETERHEFGNAAGVFLNRAQQVDMRGPMARAVDMAVHDGRGAAQADTVRGANDIDPGPGRQFVARQLLANLGIQNLCRGTGNRPQTSLLQFAEKIGR